MCISATNCYCHFASNEELSSPSDAYPDAYVGNATGRVSGQSPERLRFTLSLARQPVRFW